MLVVRETLCSLTICSFQDKLLFKLVDGLKVINVMFS